MIRTNSRPGFTLIELMIVIAIIAIIAAISIPGLLAAQRSASERNASASLKAVATSEADFRSNDRDNNRLNDYWIADVRGLYSGPTTFPGFPIKLEEMSIAVADSNPQPSSNPVTGVTSPQPKSGYFYQMCTNDENATAYGAGPPGGVDGSHNYSKFGLSCYPQSYGTGGKLIFIMNESSTIFKRDPGSVAANGPVANFPNDAAIATTWSKMD